MTSDAKLRRPRVPRWLGILLNAVLLGFPWVWVHVGLRNQKDRARYFPIDWAWEWIAPSTQLVVMENNGVARGHPDAQTLRPGMFWHVWAEFFPETDINRLGDKAGAQAA